ncbi:uncharacterized protein LOC121111598 [Gallus gallus]|uniref:uncharacterized protein LOC121111598 n=1 Tax=Gallus gallus TaxID=9031 RepID=UPI001AE21F75|nr:uncharacterized protein LOC121111598 [Gallus gallus]
MMMSDSVILKNNISDERRMISVTWEVSASSHHQMLQCFMSQECFCPCGASATQHKSPCCCRLCIVLSSLTFLEERVFPETLLGLLQEVPAGELSQLLTVVATPSAGALWTQSQKESWRAAKGVGERAEKGKERQTDFRVRVPSLLCVSALPPSARDVVLQTLCPIPPAVPLAQPHWQAAAVSHVSPAALTPLWPSRPTAVVVTLPRPHPHLLPSEHSRGILSVSCCWQLPQHRGRSHLFWGLPWSGGLRAVSASPTLQF